MSSTTTYVDSPALPESTDSELLDEINGRGLKLVKLTETDEQELINELNARGIDVGDTAITKRHWQQIFDLLRNGHIHQVLDLVRKHAQAVTGRVL